MDSDRQQSHIERTTSLIENQKTNSSVMTLIRSLANLFV
jgi:hypothetical protein